MGGKSQNEIFYDMYDLFNLVGGFVLMLTGNIKNTEDNFRL